MPQPLVWTQFKQTGATQPTPRSGHTIVTVGKTHIMFGGLDNDKNNYKDGKIAPNNQVYTLKLVQNNCEWRMLACSGDVPLPRCYHAACAISLDKMLIFGGSFTSNLRFNDTYILKTTSFQWSKPANQISGGEPKNAESKIGAPQPRYGHSATFYENKIFVFGGHGGINYQRLAFNDLYSLDTENYEWTKLEPKGNPPDPRGGHSAAMMANKPQLMIFGGWSFTSQYSNIMIYDIEKDEWIDPEIAHEIPKWNMSGIMAPSIPSWKYFVFAGSVGSFEEGGNRTNSRYVDDSFFLDVDTLSWNSINLEADEHSKVQLRPKPRESSSMFYDSGESRVLIFGGWANNWLSDLWSLNVSTITGPPYAIASLKPALGPLTGKTKIKIEGDGFKDTGILVKFSGGKMEKEVSGQYINEREIACETPVFDHPRSVEVTLCMNKGDYTITKSSFTYYLNTKAEKIIAYGSGLLFENLVGVKTTIVVQARNKNDQNRESGSDEFIVSIRNLAKVRKEEDFPVVKQNPDGEEQDEEPQEENPKKDEKGGEGEKAAGEEGKAAGEEGKAAGEEGKAEGEEGAENKEGQKEQQAPAEVAPASDVDPSIVPFEIIDNDDGSYFIVFTVKHLFFIFNSFFRNYCFAISKSEDEGILDIDIKFKDENNELHDIRGNPFKCGFVKASKANNNELTGPAVVNYITKQLKDISDFIEVTKENIEIRNKNIRENVQELINVMVNLEKVRVKNDDDVLTLDTIEEMLNFLKKKEFGKENDQKRCKKLQEEWKNLAKMAQAVKKDIQNPVKAESDKTKDNIKKFEEITLKEYANGLKKESFFQYKTGIQESFKRIGEVKQKVDEFEEQSKQYEDFAQMFEFPDAVIGSKKLMEQIRIDVNSVEKLWQRIEISEKVMDEFKKMKWGDINSMDMEDDIKKLRKALTDLRGIDKRSNAFVGINDELKKWATFLPLLGELKDPSMTTEDRRHWKKLKDLVKKEFEVTPTLELEVIWDLKLFDFKDGIEDITDQSKQELKMEKSLKKIIDFWRDIEFELVQHKNTDIHTLKMSEDNFETLEEHQLQINNMLLSKYVAYFEKEVEKWKYDLGSVYDVVQLLLEVQKTWSFLENLFIQSEEVKRELPNESAQFVGIDKDMKEIMKNGCDIKNALKFCTIEGMLKRLESIQAQLKVCEKALNEFLDSKRRAFPRFYFVSVNDLLDILSNGNSPAKINRHMSKIFQAIDNLTLKEDGSGGRPTALKMISCVGSEEVDFTQARLLAGKVENYLQDVIDTMTGTLKEIATTSFKNIVTMARKEWLKQDPAQITLLVNNIQWSKTVEECFLKLQGGDVNVMKNYLDESVKLLTELIGLVQGDLSKPMRQKIMCLITIDTHSRDVVIRLINEHVRKAEEFQWQSQLKFFWVDNDAMIRIADAKFAYNYEYLGNGPRLVITPLTDRIYVTATQALHLKMGCAPAGPAGTGKTETTKDLANALAKACYVFNCSSEMNFESMGNIYKGLASSGCWGCFDEFNRLLPEVLSVCSVQFKAVTDAIKQNVERFVIEGDEISLDPTCGVFITMNPGYLGRAELPEGLKALFRPITVVVPDLELICENMLMAEGFIHAKVLAKKFVTLYMLCRDLLSKQLHYDWGLRAIKSVLVVAGGFKRSEPDILEQALLMRALRDFNIPKIAFQDLYVFHGLLGDLFPGINIQPKKDLEFEKIISDVCIENKLDPDQEFILKVVQLSELLAIRHCVFVMGPPGAGKSSTWKILAKAQDKINKKTTLVDMDPKVVSTKDFYGYNLPSKEWKDGLFSKMLRSLAEQPDTNPKWIVLDGDLDANWIESMNSVMDDNKILTLANNERIPLKPHMRALFEIRDLRFATPATVSRAGILYISDEVGYQWRCYVKSWIKQEFPTDQEMSKNLDTLFGKYVPGTLDHIKKHCKFLVPVTPISQVISICKSLQTLLKGDIKNLEYLFVYALIWAVGGSLAEKDSIDYRKEFSTWWKGAWKTAVKFPNKGTIFDYFVDQTSDTSKFTEWSKKLENKDFDPLTETMGNVTVNTIETIATSEFIKSYLMVKHPSLLIGNSGCGKTQLAKGILKEIVQAKPENFAYQLINFNYYTDSTYLQGQIEQTLEKKAGRQYGPAGRVQLIYFVDDLNMPQLDAYDTQTAIGLLREMADYGHFYDVSKLSLKDIINTQVLAAMNPSAGSFFVNPRYQRHFWTISIPFPDNESLSLIYITFLNGHLKRFKGSIQEYPGVIVRATLTLHQAVTTNFRKTAINFHYEFNLRHMSNIFQGLLLSDPNKFTEPDKLIKLWIHECERTYGDRLVSAENLKTYKESVFEIVRKQFSNKFNFSRYFGNTPENLIFCNFISGINSDRFYDQIANNDMEKHISEALREYNDNNAFMGLVLFEDAMKHVCRITRIVLPSSGHALLVGVGGSGKQSLSKLASFIMGYSTFSITISTSYSMGDLRSDLQTLYQKCGPREEGILFLFTEGQITNERFLVYINDLLSSGEIAELYTLDEKEIIINQVRPKVKSEGKPDTRENCWTWFIDQVKKNLHMAICFSPVGDMRRRARQFPALVNCTVIDWFQPWPYEALFNVAKSFLEPIDLGEDKVRDAVVKFMPYSFTVVNDLGQKLLEQERRHAYTTPKSFLELISLFTNMLQQKRDALEKNKERYETGLVKLKETAEQVSVIEVEVKLKQVEAEAKKKEADAFAEVVGREKDKVEKENSKAQIEADKCATIKLNVEAQKSSTQQDLDAAIPLIEQAKAALDSIKKDDFRTAKSWASPPPGVPEVFSATIYLLAGYFNEAIEIDKNKKPKDISWKSALKLMKSPEEYLAKLLSFKDVVDANLVPAINVNAVKNQYLSMPSFTPETMATKSNAAKGVCSWVINIVKYYDVIQDVEPKRKALKEATEQLEEATVKLNEVESVVKKLNEELSKLTAEFDKAISEKNASIAEAERCARRLNLAQRLVTALSSENERWGKSIVVLEEQLKLMVGDVLVASSFVSYSGPFNKKFRNIMINESFMKFMKDNAVPMSPDPNPIKILTDESTIALWNKQKLPNDSVSIENGTILTNSARYPLMIDPQLQGITWIREKEKNNNLKMLRLGSKNINRDLETAIENGYSCIIENMSERIDAILMPVIARSFIKRGKNKIVKFAGKDLVLHNTFKLFLHTKLSNPHYPPEVQAESALINFTVTEVGLGDQLLSLVVARERPDLAKMKIELITQQNDFKIKLKDLEDELLYKLANAKGDILDDIALIENLENSKRLSQEISLKVAAAKITEAKINETSELYRSAASRGALFYFLLSDLPKIHSFYKYSLESFIVVINRAIDAISENKMYSVNNMIPYGDEVQPVHDHEDDDENKPHQESKDAAPQEEAKKEEKHAEPAKEGKEDEKAAEKGENKEGEEDEKNENNEEEAKEEDKPQAEEKVAEKKGGDLDEPMSPRSLKKRVEELIESLTYTAYQNTRRGLFETHKLIVVTMLCLRVLLRSGELDSDEVDHLVIGKIDSNPTPLPDSLKSFLGDAIWAACRALEQIHVFQGFCQSLETDVLQWKKWYSEEKAESADLPKAFKEISKFHRLLLLRALRPDRLPSALSQFVHEKMGERYVEQPPFNIMEVFAETQKNVPIFFVLFPGVDPTPDVEKVAATFDISSNNGRFINISMGQGQEDRAKKAIFDCAQKGYWIMLQNCHLMQNWLYGLNGLEGYLESVFSSPKTHPNFRVFISSEPPNVLLPLMQIMPESILQLSLKVANEAPQYLKANLRRAYNKFDQAFLDKCDKKPTEFKSCLFALCFFHSLMLGRKKFGTQGWSRVYNYNDGDLTICADVLFNYLSKYDQVPWDDLRYIFGEIMYGGHITDDWDRRTNRTYLKVLLRAELLQQNFNLAPLFKSPDPSKFDYEAYKKYIEEKLPIESPQMFGMHPNAEIGYLTQTCEQVFSTVLEVQGGSSGGGAAKKDDGVMITLTDFKTRCPHEFNMLTVEDKIKERTPYIVVCLQEAERMNGLLAEIKSSLEDLRLGLTGALNMTDAMENLQQSLSFNKVPDNWEKKAYFSRKPLVLWFADLIERNIQLQEWFKELITPKSLCISYLFNPMSYLTAIMQFTARAQGLPLDGIAIQTNVTAIKGHEEVVGPAENGAYIHGVYLEGAAWELGGQGQDGYLIEQKPKELHPRMPVINAVAVPLDKKKVNGQYDCPTYVTSARGQTYVFTANLNMESEDSDPNKWILSGTCILLSDD